MRLRFLDKINNMNGKQCIIGLFIFIFGFFSLAKLIQMGINAVNIMHIDYWMIFLGLYMLIVGTFMIVLNMRIIKYDKENKK